MKISRSAQIGDGHRFAKSITVWLSISYFLWFFASSAASSSSSAAVAPALSSQSGSIYLGPEFAWFFAPEPQLDPHSDPRYRYANSTVLLLFGVYPSTSARMERYGFVDPDRQFPMCTGTFIAGDAILTAAHCCGNGENNVRLANGTDWLLVPVKHCYRHPHYRAIESEQENHEDNDLKKSKKANYIFRNDIAVVQLSHSVDWYQPLEIERSPLICGTEIDLYGYRFDAEKHVHLFRPNLSQPDFVPIEPRLLRARSSDCDLFGSIRKWFRSSSTIAGINPIRFMLSNGSIRINPVDPGAAVILGSNRKLTAMIIAGDEGDDEEDSLVRNSNSSKKSTILKRTNFVTAIPLANYLPFINAVLANRFDRTNRTLAMMRYEDPAAASPFSSSQIAKMLIVAVIGFDLSLIAIIALVYYLLRKLAPCRTYSLSVAYL